MRSRVRCRFFSESVAQLVEHSAFNRNCVGSNPFRLNKMLERKRSDIITPLDIDKIFKIHGGNSYKEIKITNSQFVGRKFGEFVATKVPAK